MELVDSVVREHARQMVDCTVNGKPAHVQRRFCDEGSDKK
jgi:hypothetical protein